MPNISLYVVAILVLYVTLASSTNTPDLIGFSTYLIHRDSLESSYNQTYNVAQAIHRSRSRLSHLKDILKLPNNDANGENDVYSTVVASNAEYLIEMFVGTPPVKQLAIVDTGSDITWTQCLPCTKCYKQNQPIFDPKKSSSYKKLSCDSSACQAMNNEVLCKTNSSNCKYRLLYGDRSSSIGELAFETYKLGTTSIPKMVYGCAYYSQGTFDGAAAGIFGLGGGYLSFVGQLRDLIGGKFSYCLVPRFGLKRRAKSTISFGYKAIVSGQGVVSTPVRAKNFDTFYYLILEGVSVGKMRFPFKSIENENKAVEEGNIIIDSGTAVTYLPINLFNNLENELKIVIKAKPVQDPQRVLKLCYANNKNIRIPRIVFHFAGGADLSLRRWSIFIVHNNLLCLAIVPTGDLAIYGNLSQMNFKIGYDLEKGKVSFKQTDCSRE